MSCYFFPRVMALDIRKWKIVYVSSITPLAGLLRAHVGSRSSPIGGWVERCLRVPDRWTPGWRPRRVEWGLTVSPMLIPRVIARVRGSLIARPH
jgi:hypothetical protein